MYEQQRRQARETIIDTSISLFRKNGYDSVTVEEITKAVGIAKGTFYHFFSSKSDILFAWSAMKFAAMDVSFAVSGQGTAEQNILRLAETVCKEVSRERALFSVFLRETLQKGTPAEHGQSFDFKRVLLDAIRNSQDFDSIGEVGLEAKAQALNSLMFFETLQWVLSGGAPEGLAAHLTELLSVCINGIYK